LIDAGQSRKGPTQHFAAPPHTRQERDSSVPVEMKAEGKQALKNNEQEVGKRATAVTTHTSKRPRSPHLQ
jgi:hypothetical protein